MRNGPFLYAKNQRRKRKIVKQLLGVEEKVGLIVQAEVEYEAIVEDVRNYCHKARQLREQADELTRSGSTDLRVATQVISY